MYVTDVASLWAVDDPMVRKTLGIPLEGYDMQTRTYRFDMPTLAPGKKDKINQAI